MKIMEKPWETKSGLKRFKWTGKLITFKSKNIGSSIRRHFISTETGESFKNLSEPLPNIFLVLGFETTKSSRTSIVVGDVLLLGEKKTVKFHVPPQFCVSEEVLMAALEMFFVEAKENK